MANTKITTSVISADAITGALIADDVALGGNPTTSTQSAGNNTTRIATTAFVTSAIDNLVDSAPGTMNTLNEIAAALNDDANFNTTVTNLIAAKAAISGQTFSGDVQAPGLYVGSTNTSYDFYNNGTSYLNGAVTIDDALTITSGDLIVDTNKLFVDISTGQVGIGTNSPGGTIHGHAASPQLRLTSSADSGTPLAQIGYAGGSGYFLRLGDAANNEDVMIRSYGNTVFNGGNVGIGWPSPNAPLDIKYTDNANAQRWSYGSSQGGFYLELDTAIPTGGVVSYNFNLMNNSTAYNNNLVLDRGNVGIGTASPAHKLDVHGTIRTYASGSGNAWLYTQNDNKTYLVGVRGSSSNAFSIYDLTADKSRFRVNSDGGVAIGENNTGYTGQILSIKSGTGNNVLYGESSDANCIMSVRDNGSTTNVGYGCISNAHVFFNDGTEIARLSTGSGDKYSYSSAGLGGSGTNLHLHSDDSEIRMANNIIHSDNSGNTKFTIRTGYAVTSASAELSLDGGFVTTNVGSSYTEMMKVNTSRVTVGGTHSAGYYLRVQTSYGYGDQGAQNSSYYHNTTDRSYNYWGNACYASGGFHTYSDQKLKKEITVIDGALDSVAKMNGVTFKWKDAEKRGGKKTGKQFGVIAQNMLEVDPELPTLENDPLSPEETIETDDSYYAMDYSRLTPYFIEAIKELKAKNEALEERIKTLEG